MERKNKNIFLQQIYYEKRFDFHPRVVRDRYPAVFLESNRHDCTYRYFGDRSFAFDCAFYGIALFSGIVILNVRGIVALAVIHKVSAVLFLVLLVVLLVSKAVSNKKA